MAYAYALSRLDKGGTKRVAKRALDGISVVTRMHIPQNIQGGKRNFPELVAIQEGYRRLEGEETPNFSALPPTWGWSADKQTPRFQSDCPKFKAQVAKVKYNDHVEKVVKSHDAAQLSAKGMCLSAFSKADGNAEVAVVSQEVFVDVLPEVLGKVWLRNHQRTAAQEQAEVHVDDRGFVKPSRTLGTSSKFFRIIE